MVAANKSKKNKKVKSEDRAILYPEITAEICKGDTAITPDRAKELLGWTVEDAESDVKFGTDYLLIDEEGKKVRCTNNVNNRPLYSGVVKNLIQEHLMKRWAFNGEPIIIGQTGRILNGQHTLVSLVLADQIRHGDSKLMWDEVWGKTKCVTLDKLIVFGIDESDSTVNTMDLCKPRSLADVIYRSEFFKTISTKDRKAISRMTDNCIRFLWYRMGVCSDPFAPRRTHSEALDFIARHNSVLKAVRHIFDEEADKSISKYLPLGTASALLYLMATSKTDGDVYRNSEEHSEKGIDLTLFDKACEFFVCLSKGAEEFKEVRHAIGSLADPDTGLGGSNQEKIAILINAWQLFVDGYPLTKKALALSYTVDEDGIRHLKELPDLGGLDIGEAKPNAKTVDDDDDDETEVKPAKKGKAKKAKPEATDDEDDSVDADADDVVDDDDEEPEEEEIPTEEEIEKRKEEIRKQKAQRLLDSRKAKKEASTDDDDDGDEEPKPRKKGK